ncbi:hypothetical protein BH11ARM1_BH11ARM1_01030 [soil metagenome]
MTVLSTLASILLACTPQATRTYPAKLGVAYKIGVIGRVIGSSEKMEIQLSRLATIDSVQTGIAFGTKSETFVAKEGKKLVIFKATIKNPEKDPISVNSSQSFGLRVYDTTFKAGDIKYLGACNLSKGALNVSLKNGESVQVFTIYEFPAVTPHLRFCTYFEKPQPKSDPRYDLTNQIENPTSVFAKSNMEFRPEAKVEQGKLFDLDGLSMRVTARSVLPDGGVAVQLEVTNPMPVAGRWGFQYARAFITDQNGIETEYYPEFYITPAGQTAREIPFGKVIHGEYRFYTRTTGTTKFFTLIATATKRKIIVSIQ